ncbi:hypothetical protein [Spirillospora sp. NPDC048819]|uniref:hypothetical protein n=1 Tax=Spirillospora sp. NPDC048819 TaxID=3155268 RepID=UPI0033F7EC0D
MICRPCRERRHEECRGGSWCDCQHRPDTATPGRERPPGTGGDTEPPVNWKRQG